MTERSITYTNQEVAKPMFPYDALDIALAAEMHSEGCMLPGVELKPATTEPEIVSQAEGKPIKVK